MNRTNYLCGRLAVVLGSSLLGLSAHGQPSVSVGITVPTPSVGIVIHADSDFYEPLTPHGEWVTVGSYGRCWRPARVEVGWRPYCHGNWQMTDDGWYWVSDEPWAWATYHYGRWDFTDQYGWYWVPQTQWAPAWVSWHEGGGYVGWAPLQPSVSISVNGYVGFNQSHISPRAYVFVEQKHFMEPIRPTTVVVNNTTIINKTTVNITNTRLVNNTVINRGPATTVIEKASGRKVQAVAVHELRQKDEAVVVTKQRAAASPANKKAQAPVVAEAKTSETKAVAGHQTPAVEKAAPTRNGRTQENETAKPLPKAAVAQPAAIKESPSQKNHETQIENKKPIVAAAEHKPVVRAEPKNESGRSEGHQPSGEPKAEKNIPQRAVREAPAQSEKQESHPQEKNEEKRSKD